MVVDVSLLCGAGRSYWFVRAHIAPVVAVHPLRDGQRLAAVGRLWPAQRVGAGGEEHPPPPLGRAVVRRVEEPDVDPGEACPQVGQDDLLDVAPRAVQRVTVAVAAVRQQAGHVLAHEPRRRGDVDRGDRPWPTVALRVLGAQLLACGRPALAGEAGPQQVDALLEVPQLAPPRIDIADVGLDHCRAMHPPQVHRRPHRRAAVRVPLDAGDVMEAGAVQAQVGAPTAREQFQHPHWLRAPHRPSSVRLQ